MQITRVSPQEISAEPVAGRTKPGSIVAGRRSSAAAAAAALARAHAAARRRRSTCSTGPSGICRKRVPSAWNASTSPVREEGVVALAAGGVAEPARAEHVLDLARERRARGHDLHPAAERALEHRAHERVVGAAEDHGVDLRLAQRRAVAADRVDDAAVEREAALDDRGQVRAGDRGDVDERVGLGDRALVGAARDGRRRGEQPDAAVARRRHRLHRPGLHDAEHVDAERRLHQAAAQHRQRGRGGRVAGHHEQLDPARDQLLGDLERERLQLGRRALAVGEARGVREVDEVLVRQLHEQLVEDGEPADPRVEHADRAPAQLLGEGALRHAASVPRRPPGLLADPVDRRLELLDHRVGDPLVRERAARLHDAGEDHRHQQDQPDVLDRALPALARPRPHDPRVQPAHRLVAHRPSDPFAFSARRGAGSESSAAAATALRLPVTKACRLCVGSPRAARARRDEHVPDARAARARGRSCATRSRRCGGAATSRSSCSRSPPAPATTRAPRSSCGGATAGQRFDVVHVHFGLVAWPALLAGLRPLVVTLHGNDLLHPRSRPFTRAALPLTALPAAVSRAFSRNVPGAGRSRRVAILPMGVDLTRFRPIPRAEARARLGLDPAGPYLLFPHEPSRPLKRFDRAREAAGDVPLLTLGGVPADEVPYWINEGKQK